MVLQQIAHDPERPRLALYTAAILIALYAIEVAIDLSYLDPWWWANAACVVGFLAIAVRITLGVRPLVLWALIALPALGLEVWRLVEFADSLLSDWGVDDDFVHAEAFTWLAATLVRAALAGLVVQDIPAERLHGADAAQRLVRIAEPPSVLKLLVLSGVGFALIATGVLGDEYWRYGRFAGLLFGVLVLVVVCAGLLARLADVAFVAWNRAR